MTDRRSQRIAKPYEQGRIFTGHRAQGSATIQTLDNLQRRERGCLLDGQDKRCQRVMRHLWGSFSVDSLSALIRRQFPLCRDEDLVAVAQRITDLHCGCEGYSDATIADLLEPLL